MTKRTGETPLFDDLQRLRERVLSPPERAIRVADQERQEVSAEQQAFEAFAQCVTEIPTASPRSASVVEYRNMSRPDHSKRVEAAYRQTVMDVEHYNSAYGEPYLENLREELGAEIAVALSPDDPAPFSALIKQRVVGAARRSAASREEFVERLSHEKESLSTNRNRLSDLVGTTESARACVQQTASEAELETIAAKRQETIQQHHSLSAIDGHHLCEYLYENETWTYPVLLGLGRLREALGNRFC